MKKLFFAFVIAAACVSVSGCDKKTNSGNSGSSVNNSPAVSAKSPDEKTSELLNSVSFPEMRKLGDADDLMGVMGIDASELTEYSVYICPSGMAPDEFGVLVAKDNAAASAVKARIENRISSQSETFRNYPLAAEEVYKLDDCFVIMDGNVVSYAICADNNTAKGILG